MEDGFIYTMESSTAADEMRRWSSSDLLIIPVLIIEYFLFNLVKQFSEVNIEYYISNIYPLLITYICLILFIILIPLIKNKYLYFAVLVISIIFLFLNFSFSNLVLFLLLLFMLNFGRESRNAKSFFEIFSKFRKNVSLYTMVLFILAFLFLFKAPEVSYNFIKGHISKPLKQILNNTYTQITEIYKEAYLQGARDTLYIICMKNPTSCNNIDKIYKTIEESLKTNYTQPTINIDKILNKILSRYGTLLYILFTALYINVLDILLKIFVGLPISIILTFIKKFIEK